MESNKRARVIAIYLPQFHPIPENDKWWGKGFTEWTNVGKAKPLFKGHYQPKVPADLGYYDLRIPEVRKAQADMAKEAGIEGFMYYHYWFGNGKTLLERPFQEVLKSGEPDFPFCLAWANHSWEDKSWVIKNQYQKNRMLIEQLYPGEKDYRDHFFYLLNAFKDKRYIRIDDKPLFYIYNPLHFKDVSLFIAIWQQLAKENGLNGIYFIGQANHKEDCSKILNLGLDGAARIGVSDVEETMGGAKGKFINIWLSRLKRYLPIKILQTKILSKYNYSDIVNNWTIPDLDSNEQIYPTILPNFDHSPRSGNIGLIYDNSTPALFKKLIRKTINTIEAKKDEHKVIILKSWNEWGEGNYVEPDLKYGHGYLDALRDEIFE
ncbi:MAG: glycoside hydrolase family 99-like domain-containing protein [Candidatus Symbiothrix sp.]|jgi:hypothetical protein|nr:glycoside hydrolase family 99-like domain-containing protein [Candidatus Symbiothrix sp.]